MLLVFCRIAVVAIVVLLSLLSLTRLAPTFPAALLNDFVPVRALLSSDTNTLASPLFKLKTIGDRSFSSAEPRSGI